jgi:hypothetical protein
MKQLIEKIAAVIAGIVGSGSIWLMYRFATPGAFFTFLALWIAVLVGLAVLLRRASPSWITQLPLGITTAIACSGLFTLIEWQWWRWLLAILPGAFLTGLFGSIAYEHSTLGALHKPFRRMKMMLWVFDAYALLTTVAAFATFFPSIPLWLLYLAGGCILGSIAMMIWRMYFGSSWRQFLLWGILLVLVMTEVIWVMQLLPLGYLVASFLITWIWYMLQLFVRFHFTPQGIMWRRRAGFLGANAVLFAGVLYVARWV